MKLGVGIDGFAPCGEALGFAQEAVSAAVLVPALRGSRQVGAMSE